MCKQVRKLGKVHCYLKTVSTRTTPSKDKTTRQWVRENQQGKTKGTPVDNKKPTYKTHKGDRDIEEYWRMLQPARR